MRSNLRDEVGVEFVAFFHTVENYFRVGDAQTLASGFLLAAVANVAEAEAVECDFNDVLGFRAGDQDVRSDLELEAPEFLLAGEVLRWLAVRAARNQDCVAFCLLLRNS